MHSETRNFIIRSVPGAHSLGPRTRTPTWQTSYILDENGHLFLELRTRLFVDWLLLIVFLGRHDGHHDLDELRKMICNTDRNHYTTASGGGHFYCTSYFCMKIMYLILVVGTLLYNLICIYIGRLVTSYYAKFLEKCKMTIKYIEQLLAQYFPSTLFLSV